MKLKTKIEICGWLILAAIAIYAIKYFMSILGDLGVFTNFGFLFVLVMFIAWAIGSDNEISDKS